MNRLLAVVFLAVTSSTMASDRIHYLLLPDFLPAVTRQLQPAQLLAFESGVSLVKVSEPQIEAFSEAIHEEVGACGGFFDVTEEIESGVLAEHLVLQEVAHRSRVSFATAPAPAPAAISPRREVARLIASADQTRYWKALTALTQFPDRSASTANGEKAAKYLKDEATKIAGTLPGFKAEFVATGTLYQQPSLVVTLPGTDPSLPGIVIGAHMDTYSNSKPGADDDGSGSALVLEALQASVAAYQWAAYKHTVYFIWYSAEERGLVGSSYVVKWFKANRLAVKSAIQLDMVGFNSDDDANDIYLLTDNVDANLTAEFKQIISTYTAAKVGTTQCGYACSDHANWNRAGIPVVVPFEASVDNMNTRIHTGSDLLTYLDSEHAFRFVQVALAFLGENAVLTEL